MMILLLGAFPNPGDLEEPKHNKLPLKLRICMLYNTMMLLDLAILVIEKSSSL